MQVLFLDRYGVELTKIPESTSKTPDFEFCPNGECAFVAELKTLEYHPPSIDRGWEVEKGELSTRSWRWDNAVNRVGTWIQKGYKQLSTRVEPKVLIFLNEDNLDVLDLEEAVSGFQSYKGKSGIVIENMISNYIAKRINKVAQQIDLYVWIDRTDEGKVQFRMMTESGGRLVDEYFKPLASK